jgi:hypothetical protein
MRPGTPAQMNATPNRGRVAAIIGVLITTDWLRGMDARARLRRAMRTRARSVASSSRSQVRGSPRWATWRPAGGRVSANVRWCTWVCETIVTQLVTQPSLRE